MSGTLKVHCDDHPDGASVGGHVSGLPHPSFPTLLHPAVLRLPHEQKMSPSMTELMPVLPDPVRRRRRYVLCLAIRGSKQLTSPIVIIRSLLFGVTYPGAQKPHPVVLSLKLWDTFDAMDSLPRCVWDPSFFGSRIPGCV